MCEGVRRCAKVCEGVKVCGRVHIMCYIRPQKYTKFMVKLKYPKHVLLIQNEFASPMNDSLMGICYMRLMTNTTPVTLPHQKLVGTATIGSKSVDTSRKIMSFFVMSVCVR